MGLFVPPERRAANVFRSIALPTGSPAPDTPGDFSRGGAGGSRPCPPFPPAGLSTSRRASARGQTHGAALLLRRRRTLETSNVCGALPWAGRLRVPAPRPLGLASPVQLSREATPPAACDLDSRFEGPPDLVVSDPPRDAAWARVRDSLVSVAVLAFLHDPPTARGTLAGDSIPCRPDFVRYSSDPTADGGL